MEEKEVAERVRAELSEARFAHTQGVVDATTELARRFGANVQAARLAAWVHDIAREWPRERLLQAALRVEMPSGFALIPALLHGPIAAGLANEWFGVSDAVADAIRYHTTGRVGMSVLEKVVCLADAIERGRDYPGVNDIRAAALTDLNLALAMSFDSTIQYLLLKREPIFPLTVMARNEFWELTREVRE
ncbi:bis(5'-nucleosyl)-tetraphosphatase (symmetrical) YqeK [Alicyclobacillus sp. ALC3]|uniref:bis(5'-nucleosyl)-tetraphosphatase (symmetrical) YqeK n=1 Tax=Alicyclobacillus sp. ALC3 TaxID=2796143 RepID=UPI002378DCBD|nr:bis(5'-nucleosyl)-tetraphosphatase (symmetrical) YqeK [Alicyclobacillus sp. ALC3]WDL96316.1 bis(5'-nucleosyl)-tetraphosphatase (symmetrical) YqeK [Alicyclobacillus sp. ALC3]